MTEYAVLLPGDEARWEGLTGEQRAAVYARHEEFAKALADRGHVVVGGAELRHSREAKQVHAGADGTISIIDGPYAETVEQLTGFYLVKSDDLDDLLQVCGLLADAEGTVEVRAIVDHESGESA